MSANYDQIQKEGIERSRKALKQRKSESAAPKEGRASNLPAISAVSRCADEVEAKQIRWLWPGRIACGKVTLIAGDPGLGKSQITAALAGIVTTGGVWPVDGTRCAPGAAFFLSAEDDVADTIRPRLEAVGANLRQCHVLDAIRHVDETGAIRTRGFNLKSDLEHLAKEIDRIGNVRLVVIDPITAYLGGIDSHKNADVRALLSPLSDLAEAFGLAILGISHLNKSNAQDALQRVNGSLAFVAASRAALIVLKDKANPHRRLLLPLKNNLARDCGGLAFSVGSASLGNGIETSRIVWEREAVTITADDALNAQADTDEGGLLEEAKEFLAGLLAGGRLKAKEIEEEYREAGFSEKTIRRAKKDLGIISVKDKSEGWFWEFTKAAKDALSKNLGHLGRLQQNQGFQSEKNGVFGQGGQTNETWPSSKIDPQPAQQTMDQSGPISEAQARARKPDASF